MFRLKEALVVVLVLAGFLAAGVASPAQAADAQCQPGAVAMKYPALAGKTLKVTLTGASKPYTYRDPENLDKIIGFAADYARAAFACIGVKIEFGTADWSGLLASVSSGQSDLIWDALFYTPERAKVLDFVIYMASGSGGLVPKGNPKKISSINELCGTRVVSLIGSVENAKANEVNAACIAAKKPEIAMTTTADRASGLRLVENDRADVYLGEASSSSYDANLFQIGFRYATNNRVGVGVLKGNKVLAGAILDAITELKANGTEAKLFDQYAMDPQLTLPPQILSE